MEQTRIQMFEQETYPILFADFAKATIKHFEQHQDTITETWKKALKQYMTHLVTLQENDLIDPVGEIDISFLYTSLEDTQPKFQIDSYGEFGRVTEESMLTEYLPADWIIVEVKALTTKLEKCIQEKGIRYYIRAAQIEVFKLRAIRSLLYYFALRFKYFIENMIDFRTLAKVKKMPTFLIQIGEYMDWQKTLYAILPIVDIFNCDRSTNLKFRKFLAVYYEDKIFCNLDLSQSSFKDCTFKDSRIEECVMHDCMFDGCVFERMTVKNTKMTGSIFVNCIFQQTVFEETTFDEISANQNQLEYFEPAEFYDCSFQELSCKACAFVGCLVENCDAEQVIIEDSTTSESGFDKWNKKEKTSMDEEA